MLRFTCVVLCLVGSLSVAAGQKILLEDRNFELPKGTVTTSTATESAVDLVFETRIGGAEGAASETKMDYKETRVTEIETLGSDTYSLLLKSSDHESDVKMAERDLDSAKKREPLLGVLLIFTSKDGVWEGNAAEGELNEKQKKALEKKIKRANRDSSPYGFESREVGDEWVIQGETLNAMMGFDGEMKGGLTMKLLAVEKVDGVQCAKLKGKLDMSGELMEGMKGNITGTITILRDIESFVDLKSEGDLKMKMHTSNELMTMTGGGKFKMNEVTVIKKPTQK